MIRPLHLTGLWLLLVLMAGVGAYAVDGTYRRRLARQVEPVSLAAVFDFAWDEVCAYANRPEPDWIKGDRPSGATPHYGASYGDWALIFFREGRVVHRERFAWLVRRSFPKSTPMPTWESDECVGRAEGVTVFFSEGLGPVHFEANGSGRR